MRKILLTALLCINLAAIFSSCTTKKAIIPKNTTLEGVDISGMTFVQAKKTINSAADKMLAEIHYTVKANDKQKILSARELGIAFDTEAAFQSAKRGGEVLFSLVMNKSRAKSVLLALAEDFSTKPTDAYAEYDSCGEFKFYEAKTGAALDVDELLEALSAAIKSKKSSELTAKMMPIYSKGVSYDELVRCNSLVAEFTTFFNKSPQNAENRVKNIKKAAQKVNGTQIFPGKNFDTNAILGDRTGENGWFKAPGIRNGKYELEYGGGVCQVSTTVYNAALLCDLEIVERTPHSWPVGYIDIGRDATISTGGPNLVFKNNTKNTLTVAATVNDDEESITVKIYGKKPEDYDHIELSSEQTGTISAPQAEYVKDESLRIGEYITDRKARDGKTSATYRTFYDKSGKVIKTETVTRDTYKAFAAIVHYNE